MTKATWAMAAGGLALAMLGAAPAAAKDDAPVAPTKCDTSYGTIAVTDGDVQGWSKFNLDSPRPMIAAMIRESGCFTILDPASGKPADYLLSAVAGSQEEVDKTISMAKGAATEALVRSGAAGQVLGKVPMGGAIIGMFGGLGGKKKTVSAGLRVMSPATGQTIISGTGVSKKNVIKILGASDWVAASQASMGQYASSDDGKLLTTAFVEAYNSVVAQGAALASVKSAAAESAAIVVAVDTQLWPGPEASGTPVRALRAATELKPTGEKQGLFVKVTDNYGTEGWVSVEALR